MSSVNKAFIMGNLGADAELKTFDNGGKLVNLRIATQHSEKRGDDWENVTDWHKVTVRGKSCDRVSKLLKGERVFCEGEMRTRKYQDKDGNDRYVTEVHAWDARRIDKKVEANAKESTGGDVDDDSIPF